jgi:tetratricopeptide (TPR) repeat protein
MKPRTLLVFSLSQVTFFLALTSTSTISGQSQTQVEHVALRRTGGSVPIEQRITQEIALIREGEQHGLDQLQMGRLWAHLAIDYEDEAEFTKAESAYNHSLRILKPLPEGAADYANVLDNLGSMYLMLGNPSEAERCNRNSLAVREKIGDKLQIARGRWHLAEVELGRQRTREAQQDALVAYHEMLALKDPQATDLVSALITLTYAECSNDACMDGVTHASQSLDLARSAIPQDPIQFGQALLALGFAEWRSGTKGSPELKMRQSIEIFKAQRSSGRVYVLRAMEQYRTYLAAMRRGPEAKQVALEEEQLKKQSGYCPNCTISVYGLDQKNSK